MADTVRQGEDVVNRAVSKVHQAMSEMYASGYWCGASGLECGVPSCNVTGQKKKSEFCEGYSGTSECLGVVPKS